MLKDTICQTYLVKNNDDFNCVPLEERGPKSGTGVNEGGEREINSSRQLYKEDQEN